MNEGVAYDNEVPPTHIISYYYTKFHEDDMKHYFVTTQCFRPPQKSANISEKVVGVASICDAPPLQIITYLPTMFRTDNLYGFRWPPPVNPKP